MAKKPRSDTPICDLVERLMSTQMSTVDILAAARAVEAAATIARASTPEDRKRWADQKKRQRGAGGQMSTVDTSAAISSSGTDSSSDSIEERDSAQNVHGGHSRSKGTRIAEDWAPSEECVAYGVENLKLTTDEVRACGEEMKLWALANANRAVARKASWSLTFMGWMRRAAPQIIRNRPRNGGYPNGQAQTAGGAKVGFAGLAARARYGSAPAGPDRPSPEDLQPVNRR